MSKSPSNKKRTGRRGIFLLVLVSESGLYPNIAYENHQGLGVSLKTVLPQGRHFGSSGHS
jgi:hypothetical protein